MNAKRPNQAVRRIEARGEVYRIAAALFDYPLAETQQALEEGRLQQVLSKALEATGAHSLPPLPACDSLQALEVGYVAAFMMGRRGKPRIPLVGSAYPELLGGQSPGGYMLNVQAFYRHFDLQAAREDEGHQDEPDHLVAMLEFCSLLCHLQIQALNTGRDPGPYQRAGQDFLQRCLIPLLTALRSRYQLEQADLLAAAGQDLDATLRYLLQLLPHWAEQQRADLEQEITAAGSDSQRIPTVAAGQGLWD